MKIYKSLKIVLYCAVLFLFFIGGSIAVSEQTKSELKINTAVTQNKTLDRPINPVHLLPGQEILPNGVIVNISDLNASIIKSGNITLSNASTQGMARINAIHEAEWHLRQTLNLSRNDVLSMACNAAGECSYKVTKYIKTSATSSIVPTYNNWTESANYYENGGNNFFSAYWKVPSSPTGPTGQIIFLFPGLEPESQTDILQPVLQWGQSGHNYWELQSYYVIGSQINDSGITVNANEGDTVFGVIQQYPNGSGNWDVDAYDMTSGGDSSISESLSYVYPNIYGAVLEVYNVDTCSQFPGSTDFYNIVVDNVTPSWIPNQIQSGCGLSVNTVSSSEVILNTLGPLENWNYSKIITIKGTTAGAQTNYQMKLTLYNSTGTDTPGNVYLGGNASSDFRDIRFTKSDGTTLLNYWIESYTPGVSAVVWVKVDSIPASPNTATIYLYYNNAAATTISSGTNTFEFFDDFLGNSINTSKWSTFGGVGSVTVSNSIVTITAPYGSWSGMTGQTFLAPPHAFRGKVQFAQPGSIRNGFGADNYNSTHYMYFDTELDSSPQRLRANNACRSSSSWTYNAYSIFEVRWTSTKARYFENDLEKSGSPVTGSCIPTDNQGVYFETWNAHISSDWVLIRNYADPEPTWG
ncbi:Uncharacterised protein [uncultured archaeon]|nr:Uncharacterised protein [uncultured archaeon]